MSTGQFSASLMQPPSKSVLVTDPQAQINLTAKDTSPHQVGVLGTLAHTICSSRLAMHQIVGYRHCRHVSVSKQLFGQMHCCCRHVKLKAALSSRQSTFPSAEKVSVCTFTSAAVCKNAASNSGMQVLCCGLWDKITTDLHLTSSYLLACLTNHVGAASNSLLLYCVRQPCQYCQSDTHEVCRRSALSLLHAAAVTECGLHKICRTQLCSKFLLQMLH